MTDDLVSVSPIKVGDIIDSDGDTAPMYLMGYLEGDPIYRTTYSLATGNDASLDLNVDLQKIYLDREGHEPGSYQFRWPAIFPDVLIPECGLMQADITIRKEVSNSNKNKRKMVRIIPNFCL